MDEKAELHEEEEEDEERVRNEVWADLVLCVELDVELEKWSRDIGFAEQLNTEEARH